MMFTKFRLSAAACALCALSAPALAVPLAPSALSIDVPMGTNNPGGAGVNVTPDPSLVYVDDIYVHAMTFGSQTFLGGNLNLRGAIDAEVTSGFSNVNLEWGDNDTDSDGDASGTDKLGVDASLKESTDPAIQNPGILSVFADDSLTEMTDGESGNHSYKVLFKNGILDNDNGIDPIPEIVFFERGRNDVFTIELILGGTFAAPVLSAPLTINSSQFFDLGLRVDTTEISSSQTLGVAGFDLNDWGLDAGQAAYGFVFTGSGADLSGVFASGEESQFVPPIPLPAGVWLMGGALGAAGWISRRRKKQAQAA